MAIARSVNVRFVVAMLMVGRSAWAQAQTTDEVVFQGPYVGGEFGSIDADALITFDGVTDPAGRSRFGFGVFAGYDYTANNFLIGAEVSSSVATDADPFTFDPGVVGFSALELGRGPAFGLEARAGYIVARRILIFGTLGYGRSEHEYFVDKMPLDEITGKSPSGSVGSTRYGGGVEGAITRHLHLRLIYRTFSGGDLSTSDFEPLVSNKGLDHFDFSLDESQILVGVLWIF